MTPKELLASDDRILLLTAQIRFRLDQLEALVPSLPGTPDTDLKVRRCVDELTNQMAMAVIDLEATYLLRANHPQAPPLYGNLKGSTTHITRGRRRPPAKPS